MNLESSGFHLFSLQNRAFKHLATAPLLGLMGLSNVAATRLDLLLVFFSEVASHMTTALVTVVIVASSLKWLDSSLTLGYIRLVHSS